LSAYLAKLSVSPFKASGAMWLISGRNPTRASVKLEAQRGRALDWASLIGSTDKRKVSLSGLYSATKKNV